MCYNQAHYNIDSIAFHHPIIIFDKKNIVFRFCKHSQLMSYHQDTFEPYLGFDLTEIDFNEIMQDMGWIDDTLNDPLSNTDGPTSKDQAFPVNELSSELAEYLSTPQHTPSEPKRTTNEFGEDLYDLFAEPETPSVIIGQGSINAEHMQALANQKKLLAKHANSMLLFKQKYSTDTTTTTTTNSEFKSVRVFRPPSLTAVYDFPFRIDKRKSDLPDTQYTDIEYLNFKLPIIGSVSLSSKKIGSKFAYFSPFVQDDTSISIDQDRGNDYYNDFDSTSGGGVMSVHDQFMLVAMAIVRMNQQLRRVYDDYGDETPFELPSKLHSTLLRNISTTVYDGLMHMDYFEFFSKISFCGEDYSVNTYENMMAGKLTNYFSFNEDVISKPLLETIDSYQPRYGKYSKMQESEKLRMENEYARRKNVYGDAFPNFVGRHDRFKDWNMNTVDLLYKKHFVDTLKLTANADILKELVGLSARDKLPTKHIVGRIDEKSKSIEIKTANWFMNSYASYIRDVYAHMSRVMANIKSPFYRYMHLMNDWIEQTTAERGPYSNEMGKFYGKRLIIDPTPVRDFNLLMVYQLLVHFWHNTTFIHHSTKRDIVVNNNAPPMLGLFGALKFQCRNMQMDLLSEANVKSKRPDGTYYTRIPELFCVVMTSELLQLFTVTQDNFVVHISFDQFKNLYEQVQYSKLSGLISSKDGTSKEVKNSIWFFSNSITINSGSTWCDPRPRNLFKIINYMPMSNRMYAYPRKKQVQLLDAIGIDVRTVFDVNPSSKAVKPRPMLYAYMNLELKDDVRMELIYGLQGSLMDLELVKFNLGRFRNSLSISSNDITNFFIVNDKELLKKLDDRWKSKRKRSITYDTKKAFVRDEIKIINELKKKNDVVSWSDISAHMKQIKNHIQDWIQTLVGDTSITDDIPPLTDAFSTNVSVTIKSLEFLIATISIEPSDTWDKVMRKIQSLQWKQMRSLIGTNSRVVSDAFDYMKKNSNRRYGGDGSQDTTNITVDKDEDTIRQSLLLQHLMDIINKQMYRSVTNLLWRLEQAENGTYVKRYFRNQTNQNATDENKYTYEYNDPKYGLQYKIPLVATYFKGMTDENIIRNAELDITMIHHILWVLNMMLFNRLDWSLGSNPDLKDIIDNNGALPWENRSAYKKFLVSKIQMNDATARPILDQIIDGTNIIGAISSEANPMNRLYYFLVVCFVARYYLIWDSNPAKGTLDISNWWDIQRTNLTGVNIYDPLLLKTPIIGLSMLFDKIDDHVAAIGKNASLCHSFVQKKINRRVLVGLVQLCFPSNYTQVPKKILVDGNCRQEALEYLSFISTESSMQINGITISAPSRFFGQAQHKTVHGNTYGIDSKHEYVQVQDDDIDAVPIPKCMSYWDTNSPNIYISTGSGKEKRTIVHAMSSDKAYLKELSSVNRINMNYLESMSPIFDINGNRYSTVNGTLVGNNATDYYVTNKRDRYKKPTDLSDTNNEDDVAFTYKEEDISVDEIPSTGDYPNILDFAGYHSGLFKSADDRWDRMLEYVNIIDTAEFSKKTDALFRTFIGVFFGNTPADRSTQKLYNVLSMFCRTTSNSPYGGTQKDAKLAPIPLHSIGQNIIEMQNQMNILELHGHINKIMSEKQARITDRSVVHNLITDQNLLWNASRLTLIQLLVFRIVKNREDRLDFENVAYEIEQMSLHESMNSELVSLFKQNYTPKDITHRILGMGMAPTELIYFGKIDAISTIVDKSFVVADTFGYDGNTSRRVQKRIVNDVKSKSAKVLKLDTSVVVGGVKQKF